MYRSDKKEVIIADLISISVCSMDKKIAKNIPVKNTLQEQYIEKRASTHFTLYFCD